MADNVLFDNEDDLANEAERYLRDWFPHSMYCREYTMRRTRRIDGLLFRFDFETVQDWVRKNRVPVWNANRRSLYHDIRDEEPVYIGDILPDIPLSRSWDMPFIRDLVKSGYIEFDEKGRATTRLKPPEPITNVVAIEYKRLDQAKAVEQALDRLKIADYCYIVSDAERIGWAENKVEEAGEDRIGLIKVSHSPR